MDVGREGVVHPLKDPPKNPTTAQEKSNSSGPQWPSGSKARAHLSGTCSLGVGNFSGEVHDSGSCHWRMSPEGNEAFFACLNGPVLSLQDIFTHPVGSDLAMAARFHPAAGAKPCGVGDFY